MLLEVGIIEDKLAAFTYFLREFPIEIMICELKRFSMLILTIVILIPLYKTRIDANEPSGLLVSKVV